jgi:hypothetical protein
MNYRKLSMLALLLGIGVVCLPVQVSAANTYIQTFFTGPVLVTPNTEFHVCATNAALLSQGPNNKPATILIGLLSADDSRILFSMEIPLTRPGQGKTGDCLVVSPAQMANAVPGPHVIAFAGDGFSVVQSGNSRFLIEGSGGIPGGGCITASLQLRDASVDPNNPNIRYIPMELHQH